jgi:putative membrane protein
VQTHVRNLARFTWISVVAKNPDQQRQKRGAMNLIVAYASATKHYLREEPGYEYSDLGPFLAHLPEFSPDRPDAATCNNLPLEISYHMQAYVAHARKTEQIDVPMQGQMLTSISVLIDALTAFERIRNSPIPFAYSIHLKQTLLLYLLSLPFQLVPSLFWATIPAVMIASFTLLGIEAIGAEIEDPLSVSQYLFCFH